MQVKLLGKGKIVVDEARDQDAAMTPATADSIPPSSLQFQQEFCAVLTSQASTVSRASVHPITHQQG